MLFKGTKNDIRMTLTSSANFLSLSDEERVILSAFISTHASRKQEKVNKASELTKLPRSLAQP